MTSRGQNIFAVVVIVGPLVVGYMMRLHREGEIKERLEACFRDDPSSAARYYSRRTPSEDKEAIFYACISEAVDLDDGRDPGQ